jgi:uncharacterized protein (DUF2235 family)
VNTENVSKYVGIVVDPLYVNMIESNGIVYSVRDQVSVNTINIERNA